jgi:hypothetical protein
MTLALVSMWSAPNSVLLKQSHGTLYVTQYQDNNSLSVIEVNTIVSVVAMVPMLPDEEGIDSESEHTENNLFFLVKRPSLEAYELAGIREDEGNEDEEELKDNTVD